MKVSVVVMTIVVTRYEGGGTVKFVDEIIKEKIKMANQESDEYTRSRTILG